MGDDLSVNSLLMSHLFMQRILMAELVKHTFHMPPRTKRNDASEHSQEIRSYRTPAAAPAPPAAGERTPA